VTASPNYYLSGHIKVGTVGVANVFVRLTRNGTQVQTTTTNIEGGYALNNLEAGAYVVMPTKYAYVMTPTSKAVTVTASVGNCDFQATRK
jgi:SdrD B-like domain